MSLTNHKSQFKSHIISGVGFLFAVQHTILSTEGESGRKARSTRNPDDFPESAVLPLDDGAIIKSRPNLRNCLQSVNALRLTPTPLSSTFVHNSVNTRDSKL